MRVTNVIPQDPNLKYINPPAFGFNVLGESTNLNCFSNTGNEWKKEKLEILEGNRIEVMFTKPFSKGSVSAQKLQNSDVAENKVGVPTLPCGRDVGGRGLLPCGVDYARREEGWTQQQKRSPGRWTIE